MRVIRKWRLSSNTKTMNERLVHSSRRSFLAAVVGVAAEGFRARRARAQDVNTPEKKVGLGFSLYGMKSLALLEAIKSCRTIGYDSIELPVMADWPADSAKLSAEARKELRGALANSGLRLSAIMENLPALVDGAKHRANLDRLKAAAEVGRELSPVKLPVIETILGGSAGKWDAVKQQLVEKLGDWADVLAQAKVTLAVKAHISNAMQRPEQLVWLLEQVNSPWIKAAYDYSHFQLQGLALADTVATLLPHTRFVHVKDSKPVGDKWQFVLPGEGTIDYRQLTRLLAAGNYDGDIVVEVSGQVSSRPGYDPIAAARKCYEHLRPRVGG